MRSFLDRLYLASGWLSALVILAIAILISTQVFLNFSTRVLNLPLPATIPSYADFAGFMLAAATFLAMPYTFRSGGHIRVSLITDRLADRLRLGVEIAVLIVAAFLVGFAVWFIISLTIESWQFNDKSSGMIPVPLWLPQSVMALGMFLLLIAIIDTIAETLRNGHPAISGGDEV